MSLWRVFGSIIRGPSGHMITVSRGKCCGRTSASVADSIADKGGCFPKFQVIRAPDVSQRYLFGICTRIPYDHDTLRGYRHFVS